MTVIDFIKNAGSNFETDFAYFMHKGEYYSDAAECALRHMASIDVRAAHVYDEYRTIMAGKAIQEYLEFEHYKHECEEDIRNEQENFENAMIQERYFDVERHMDAHPTPAWKVAVDNIIHLLEAA